MYSRNRLARAAIAVVLSILVMMFVSSAIQAAPQSQVTGTPTDDAFVHGTLGAFDDLKLYASWAASPGDKPSSYIIMKFDLNAMTTGWAGGDTIQQARLNVAALSCDGGENVNVSLWGMPDSFDSWSETTLPAFAATEGGAAAATSLKATVDEGTVNGVVAPVYYHWTDTGSGSFASWLQSQRTSGATQGIVTLMLRLDGPAETSVTFEDRELSGLAASCTESKGAPKLQISGDGSPLAITLSTFHAADPAVNWLLYGGLGLLGLVAVVGTVVYRQRAVAR